MATNFLVELCDDIIFMERQDLHFWDYQDDPEGYKKAPDHLKGTSSVQFISTSDIVIHTVDVMKNVHLNIFSCKDFEEAEVIDFAEKWFKGSVLHFKKFPRHKDIDVEIRKMNGYNFL